MPPAGLGIRPDNAAAQRAVAQSGRQEAAGAEDERGPAGACPECAAPTPPKGLAGPLESLLRRYQQETITTEEELYWEMVRFFARRSE